jgi:hypothetical protein
MTHAGYDGEADARAALPGMLAAARDRIGGLPQDQAAELAYQASRVSAWLTRKKDDQALQAIVRDYAGTEAALQAELDLLGSAVGFDPWKRADAFARFAEEHPGTCAAAFALRMEANEVGSAQGTSGRATNPDPTDRVLRALGRGGDPQPPVPADRRRAVLRGPTRMERLPVALGASALRPGQRSDRREGRGRNGRGG